MARILITSGPTRQSIDPVRFLTNASSGQMGCCLARSALDRGHDVVVVSGPVALEYPSAAEVVRVISTNEMLRACQQIFPSCDGLIGAAAPCDYQPVEVADHKIRKTGQPLEIKLVETPDVVAEMGRQKQAAQWTIGFALETDDARFRALAKLQRKCCDLVILNGVSAIDSNSNSIEIIAPDGTIVGTKSGTKQDVANYIFEKGVARILGATHQ